MHRIGDDLLLLLIGDNGRVGQPQRVPYMLMGSELVRLASLGRIEIDRGRIVVRIAEATGDPRLDSALASLAGERRPPRASRWVGHPRRGVTEEYLDQLVAQGAVRRDVGGLFNTARWYVADRDRSVAAKRRLDALMQSTGPVTTEDAAFAGLAHAVGLDQVLCPGWANRALRKRLEQIARGTPTSRAVTEASVDATTAAAVHASSQTAIDAANQAAVAASTQTAIDAAIQASIDAAVTATHHAHDAGGGHHGH